MNGKHATHYGRHLTRIGILGILVGFFTAREALARLSPPPAVRPR